MKRKIIAITAAVSSALMMAVPVSAEDITVTVNGERVEFPNAAPLIENDRTLVPMRAIFEALGATVEWDEATKTVISYNAEGNTAIVMQIDCDKMFVNDTEIALDVPPKIVDDSTVVPVRAIAEAMDCTVEWDAAAKTVIITKNTSTEIANPWTECTSLDELNGMIASGHEVNYSVNQLKNDDNLKAETFRYLEDLNMTEIIYSYEKDGFKAEIVVRAAPGDTDISGINGGEKYGEGYLLEESYVDIYKSEDTLYATWSTDIPLISHSAAVIPVNESDNTSEEIIKKLLDDIVEQEITNFPKG